MKIKQTFTWALLHPRYWMTWFGLGVLFLLVQLPYPLLMKLGSSAGRLSRIFLKRRVSIARRNLELCFPTISYDEREAMIDNNFASLGMALVETGMAWFWSDRRVRQWFDVSGLEHLQNATAKGQGVMVIGIHFMSLELGGRAMGLCQPMMAMYRPHNNKAMEMVQTWGRSRSNKAMIDRKDLRGMVQALKRGEAVWFAPDQDYGPKGSVFAPFFAVKNAATTNGTYTISRLAKPAMMTTVLIRKPNALGYQLVIQPELQDYPYHDEQAAACYMNKVIEKEIMRAPEQYLWLHRRFKTRPAGEVSLYA
ncbi:kdo(2)-lipid IV(A) palmitoleoyltransferase [Pectobacterium aquaticum]|uniref:Lipid A biosynthesis acyltransferase n=1 Tax=Pectobacterium aquaticum TaxID=2204145 RepID=A0AA93AQP6_9GAMM|nr:kdo(2)-lipid IV(A) palmitoleoyltransferase [Pectobacterium aquaticum]PLY37722.1 lipid A biosynthesis palmitoleoyl acyltransferase [Pectobacterium carotovorum]MCH5048844.1 kdo(2)-lipid IV(A) palmitoleoyltransferase [Pectobacterium aquaticum]RRN96930.1 kdo(2)-lipid IV(A) palmitoleoyltransferase [Pectobacterium aquaticum]RRO05527.1 kdo(2)-lipid IV(A) palmitoleoyltransferase [Pectobacterium aquaticum]RRO22011.1 kdo(2)-lipid IV(A) palmitoleoyltransferase [Pectobacterium aquaticum]